MPDNPVSSQRLVTRQTTMGCYGERCEEELVHPLIVMRLEDASVLRDTQRMGGTDIGMYLTLVVRYLIDRKVTKNTAHAPRPLLSLIAPLPA